MRLLIAISGKQGAGKTAAADYLVEKYNFKKISFSDKIKEVAMDLFGASYEETYGKSKNRILLQKIGYHTREIDHNVWTTYLTRKISESTGNIVVDDLRLKSEFSALKKLGFKMIRINADDEIRRSRIPYYAGERDITETDLEDIEDWDSVLENNSGKDNLHKQLQDFMKNFKD